MNRNYSAHNFDQMRLYAGMLEMQLGGNKLVEIAQ